MKEIKGVGPETPTITNKLGGRQSATPYAFHLTDAKAMFKLAEVLAEGAKKYERDNWRKIDLEDHLNHALQHIYAHMAGDTQDAHLEHAFCRLMMAVALNEPQAAPSEVVGTEPILLRYCDLKPGQVFHFIKTSSDFTCLFYKLERGYRSFNGRPHLHFIPEDENMLYIEADSGIFQCTSRSVKDVVVLKEV